MSAAGAARPPVRHVADVTVGDRARRAVADGARRFGDLRVVEFVLGILLMVEVGVPALGIPANAAALVGLILIAIFRRPTHRLPDLEWLVPLVVVALGYLALLSFVTVQHDYALDWKRRLFRFGLVALCLFLIPSGRIHMRSLVTGFSAGLLANIPLWAVFGLGAENYRGTLTGLLVDKNVAGLAYAVGVFAVLAVLRGRWSRILIVLGLVAGLWLTASRTSLAACAAGFIWFIVAPRVPTAMRWLLGLGIYIAVQIVSEDFSRVGRFSDRVGSDLLRERIDRASLIAVHEAGFFGRGLGEAIALVNGSGWFFHNSYWSALVEGGWPWLIVLLLITGVFVLKPFGSGRIDPTAAAIQAGAVALLVCAERLGEVFMTSYWMLIIALELWRRSVPIDEPPNGTPPRE